jgi:hypothetical protein
MKTLASKTSRIFQFFLTKQFKQSTLKIHWSSSQANRKNPYKFLEFLLIHGLNFPMQILHRLFKKW